jgi:hypothetical protein
MIRKSASVETLTVTSMGEIEILSKAAIRRQKPRSMPTIRGEFVELPTVLRGRHEPQQTSIQLNLLPTDVGNPVVVWRENRRL